MHRPTFFSVPAVRRLARAAPVTLFAFALVLSVAASPARGASAPTPAGTGAHGPALAAPHVPSANLTLFDNNSGDSGIGIVSQNFEEADFAIYDAEGADDFTVPAGHIWTVKEVVVTGVYFNGSGPADSENVRFYTNQGSLPNQALKAYPGVVGADNGGSFDITLPTAVTFSGGPSGGSGRTYWMSVVANMSFNSGGEWGWESSNNSAGFADVWRNPGDGFGTGCTSFTSETSCIPDGQGPSKMFALKGSDKVTT